MFDKVYKVADEPYTIEKMEVFEGKIGQILPVKFKELIVKYKGTKEDFDFIESYEKQFGYDPTSFFHNGEEVMQLRFLPESLFFSDTYRAGWVEEALLPKTLISFATDGAGRYFCFDYALEKNGKVPVVIVMPDADAEERGRYIADDFEQFLEMLGNPEMEAPYYTIEYPYIENNE